MRRRPSYPCIVERSEYQIVGSRNDEQPIVWIADLNTNGAISVTNDAQRVCQELNMSFPGHRIIYRDSQGEWDELVHVDGVFKRYAPARELEPE